MNKILLIVLLISVIFVSGCVNDITGNDEIDGTSEVGLPVGAVLFSNQSVNTLTDAETLFSSYKENLWEAMNVSGPMFNMHIEGTPIYDAMSVETFDGSISNEVFSGNFGTINFMMLLPYVNVGDDYKIENGNVLISYCNWGNVAPATQVGETEVCPSDKNAWKEAPVVKFWTNEMGVIFAKGITFTPFEVQLTPIDNPRYVKISEELDLTLTITPKMDINNFNVTLNLPPEIELVNGNKNWNGNVKALENTTITWKITGLTTGNYWISVDALTSKTWKEIRVENPAEGIGVPTE